ncbi:hypothetical protein OVY01_21915 [Robbsia sp. Bb-Pol-6]|uniref:Transposase n=1 Tax=Robbsia betulipollinis TaxID=2981849 RepID=A0ABT3ZTB6_9BURK|nr:hypothetical protein [Robbsia betulipollinis]MCY0389801.1 hypothetical protein [Robbsia betulipollinis]
MPSLSRPGVSNDNPYSESLFKTLKYRPAGPLEAFDGLAPRAPGWVHWCAGTTRSIITARSGS